MAIPRRQRPKHHAQNMEQRLHIIINLFREDIGKVDEPRFRAMFETVAEVLGRLVKAFRDYQQKSEKAWRG